MPIPRLRYEDMERCPVLSVSIRQESRLVSVGKEGSLGAEKFRFLAVRSAPAAAESSAEKDSHYQHHSAGRQKHGFSQSGLHAGAKKEPENAAAGRRSAPAEYCARSLDWAKLPGLCEWLGGRRQKINIYRLESLGLWMLPAGCPQNPLELMQSGKLSPLMEQLEAWFDWIVIDSPPVLPLADTSLWSRLADGILLVTREGYHRKTAIEARPRGALKNRNCWERW